jgi:transmembrane sensor
MIQEVLKPDHLRDLAPDEAAATLTLRCSEPASAHDQEALAAWLRLDEANVQAWERAQGAWRAFDDAGDDEILNAMRQAAREARPAAAAAPRGLAAAAAIVILLAGGLFGLFEARMVPDHRTGGPLANAHSGAPATAPVGAEYATAKGPPAIFGLPDGSRLTLDTDSAVSIAFTPQRRDLRLIRGRAFFDVKHDASRPFSVRAGEREVVAVGTRFDVKLDPGRMRVVLVEGRVMVRSPDRAAPPTMLRAGQQLISRHGAPPEVSEAQVDEALNWQRGYLTFDDETLSAAAAELNRYSNDRLVVRDPRVAALRVTGQFRAGDVARFGRTLAEIHPVRIVRTGPEQYEIVAAN